MVELIAEYMEFTRRRRRASTVEMKASIIETKIVPYFDHRKVFDISCASVMDIAKRAGHKSPDITMIYSHRYANKDEIIARQLDDMMRGGMEFVGEK